MAFAALVALAAGAVLSVPYVATHDGPNHLANCVLGHRLQDPTSWLHRYVELGAPITGQGFQVLCGPLVGWMDPFTAYALTLAIAVVLFGVAASVLALSLHRDSPVWAFGFAVALGWVFYMGFLPFHIASSLGLLAVALAVRLDPERGLGYLGLALVLLTTAYAHVLPAVEAGAVVLLVVVARAETGRRMQALLRVALAGLPASAQDAADRLVKAGVTSILNFAPVVLSVPIGITIRKVDLAVELQILSYHEQRRATAQSGGQLHAVPNEPGRGATA